MREVKVGLEVLKDNELYDMLGQAVAIVANQTSVTKNFEHIVDILINAKVTIKLLFALEHGIRGEKEAGEKIYDYVDKETGLYVYSLYGKRLRPEPKILSKIDTIIFDIQDVGARFYTYISALFYLMDSIKHTNIRLIVLDRPNPITGIHIEGKVLNNNFKSYVGVWTLPIRYGLTIGELANLFNVEAGFNVNLKVIKMKNWKRVMWYDQTTLPWIPPSPNMPSLTTALVYPGACLIEGTNVSEGRGTTKPFEYIGAPWIDSRKLIKELEKRDLPGVKFRRCSFIPYTSKYANKICHGIHVYVANRDEFQPVRIYIHIIDAIMTLHHNKFTWVKVGKKYKIDLLFGSDELRKYLPTDDLDSLIDDWERETKNFERKVIKKYFMYPIN